MVPNQRGLRDEGGTTVFSNDYHYGFACTFDDIEDTAIKQEADQWYSDYVKLMEYSRNTEYGKTKCFRCLLSPDREEAAIFIGMNKTNIKVFRYRW